MSFVVGLLQRRAAKTILAAPFRRTGELARGGPAVADARGITSCEGRVAPYEPVLAPCSGQPCVYFELEIVREWERCVTTEDGTKVEHGSDTVQRIEGGGVFLIDDGTGAIAVDSREGMSVELDTSFEQAVPVAHGDVVFGGFRAYVPPADGEKRGRSVKVVEKIVPPGGAMFVLGQLANGRIGKPQGLFGTLRASRNGRAAMIGTAKRNAVVG
ncbi:MAG TPA: GIDE domain-containing protein, partial [Labilithrix sp.]